MKIIKPGPHYQKRVRRAMQDPSVGAVVILVNMRGGPYPVATQPEADALYGDAAPQIGHVGSIGVVLPPAVRVDL